MNENPAIIQLRVHHSFCSGQYSLCSAGLSASQPAVLFFHTKSISTTSHQYFSQTMFEGDDWMNKTQA